MAERAEATLRPYEPGFWDKIASSLMGDGRASPERRRMVEGLLGTSGLGDTEDMSVRGVLAPQTPADVALMAMGPAGKVAGKAGLKAAGVAAGGLLGADAEDAYAGAGSAGRKGAKNIVQRVLSRTGEDAAGGAVAAPAIRQTVSDPVRLAYPGIYKDPRDIAREAAAMVGPENPALKELFGVTRDDLYQIGQQGRRQGNMDPVIATKPNARGSEAATKIMNPENAQRMVNALAEAEKYPQLVRGMDAWYVMDPAYQRTAQLVGPDKAKQVYGQFNTMVGMASPGSEVLTEINRGTAANMLANLGRFDDFARYGGMAGAKRGADFPPELQAVIGHPYHSTSHAGPMRNYLDKGYVDMGSPKVPLYIQSSGVPETGFQTKLPVPDAHFTRATGMPDTRGAKDYGVSMKMPEYQPVGPWFAQNVAQPLGIEAVPAQARMWGTFAPQTGVDTTIGAPKLELLAQRIKDEAARRGVNAQDYRDQVLLGRAHAGWALPAAGLGGYGLLSDPQEAQQ